jgi:ribosome biogenesis GTPase A
MSLFRGFSFDGQVSWYPGHMKKNLVQMQERIREVDVVLELRDARISFLNFF